jgi:hypothetical protein
MTRRISSSRPITGSSLPLARQLGQIAAVLLERLVGALGFCDVTRCDPRTEVSAWRIASFVAPYFWRTRAAVAVRPLSARWRAAGVGAEVLVLQAVCLGLRGGGDLAAGADGPAATRRARWDFFRQLRANLRGHAAGIAIQLAQISGRSPLLLDERQQQVLGGDLRVSLAIRQLLRADDRLLGFLGVFLTIMAVGVGSADLGRPRQVPATLRVASLRRLARAAGAAALVLTSTVNREPPTVNRLLLTGV